MNKTTLVTKMVFLVSFSLLILTATSIGLLIKFNLAQKKMFTDELKSYTINLQDAIGSQFFERYGDVQAFAKNTALQNPKAPKKIQEVLNHYIRLYQIYDIITFVDKKGNLISASNIRPDGKTLKLKALKKKNFGGLPWFFNPLRGTFSKDLKKGFSGTYVGAPKSSKIVSQVYQEKRLNNVFSTRVLDSKGDLIGILAAHANFVWVEYEFATIYKRFVSLGLKNTELTLLDGKGNIVIDFDPAHHNKGIKPNHDFRKVINKFNLAKKGILAAQKVIKGHSGVMDSFHARKKVDQIAAYHPIKGEKFIESLKWNLLIRFEKEEAFHKVNSKTYFFTTLITLAFFLLSFISFLFSKKISNSLSKNTDTMVKESEQMDKANKKLTKGSKILAETSTNQAEAIQETVAAVLEISSTVKRSVEYAKILRGFGQRNCRASNIGDSGHGRYGDEYEFH